MLPSIEFAKSTVDLENRIFILDMDNTYMIFDKKNIVKTTDKEFIECELGCDEYDPEIQDPVEYISYWDGHNTIYINLDEVYFNGTYFSFQSWELVEVVEVYRNYNQFANEYAIIKTHPEKYPSHETYYKITGTSCRSNDIFPTITLIGDRDTYEKYDKEDIEYLG